MSTEVEVCWSSWALNKPEDYLSPADVIFDGLKYRHRDSNHFWGHHDMGRTLSEMFPDFWSFVTEHNLNVVLEPRLAHVRDRWAGEHGDWRIKLYACFETEADAVFFTIWMYSQDPPP